MPAIVIVVADVLRVAVVVAVVALLGKGVVFLDASSHLYKRVCPSVGYHFFSK